MIKTICVAWVLTCSILMPGNVDAETINNLQQVAFTEESLAQMSRDSTVCAIKRPDGKYILANKEDTKVIEESLKEFENEWLDDAEFVQCRLDNGRYLGSRDIKKFEDRLYLYKNGAKIYDLLLIEEGLCMDQGGEDDHRYLWFSWADPLYRTIGKIKSPEYTSQTSVCESAEKTSTSSDSRSVRKGDKRNDKKKLAKGMGARDYRFEKFLCKHFKRGRLSVTVSPILNMDACDHLSFNSEHTQEGDSLFMYLRPENLKKLRDLFNKMESDGVVVPKEFKTELENAEKLMRESKSLVVCTIRRLIDEEVVYVKGEDAKLIEKRLDEFGEKWLKDVEFTRIMEKVGYRPLSEAEKRDLREKGKIDMELLFIHKNRVKTHDVVF